MRKTGSKQSFSLDILSFPFAKNTALPVIAFATDLIMSTDG